MVNMKTVICNTNTDIYIQSSSYRNVYIFPGDFLTFSHYEKVKNIFLQEKCNVFLFEYTETKLEREYSDLFLSVLQKLHQKFFLIGEDILIGHSKGAHIVMLMSQKLNDQAKYILINPLIRIVGKKIHRDRQIIFESLLSMIFHRNIQFSYKTFSKRFLDPSMLDCKKREMYEKSVPSGIKSFMTPTVLSRFEPNHYIIFASKDDSAVDYNSLLDKLDILKKKWNIQIEMREWIGSHCCFLECEEQMKELLLEIL